MGELDKRQKLYFRDANRFADLWNALMFDGEQIILPEELEEADSVQDIVLKNNSMERIADLIRKRRKNGEILAIMILENQGKTNPVMPLQVMFDEALAYHKQVADIQKKNLELYEKLKEKGHLGVYFYHFTKNDKVRPVTTIVLCWDDKGWDGPRSLWDMIDFRGMEELKRFVPDYPINVYDMSSVHDENLFQSDLRSLIGLYKRKNNARAFGEFAREVAKNQELDESGALLLAELINNKRLLRKLEKIKKENDQTNDQEGGIMCKAIDDMLEAERIKTRKEDQKIIMSERRRTEREKLKVEKQKQKYLEEKRQKQALEKQIKVLKQKLCKD